MCVLCRLGEEYRPVQLRRVVLGYPFAERSSDFRFDLNLTYKLHGIIDQYSQGKPTLVVSVREDYTSLFVFIENKLNEIKNSK
jgi:hypothetical protein